VTDGSVGGRVEVGDVVEGTDDEACVEVDTGTNASNRVEKQPISLVKQLSAST
jgi:hypothetical protein